MQIIGLIITKTTDICSDTFFELLQCLKHEKINVYLVSGSVVDKKLLYFNMNEDLYSLSVHSV